MNNKKNKKKSPSDNLPEVKKAQDTVSTVDENCVAVKRRSRKKDVTTKYPNEDKKIIRKDGRKRKQSEIDSEPSVPKKIRKIKEDPIVKSEAILSTNFSDNTELEANMTSKVSRKKKKITTTDVKLSLISEDNKESVYKLELPEQHNGGSHELEDRVLINTTDFSVRVDGYNCPDASVIKEAQPDEDNVINITASDICSLSLSETNGKMEGVEGQKEDVLLDWPKEDLTELIRRMEVCIPENDTLSFHKRVEKLQWDAIVFKNYTIEDCKKTWVLLQKKIRRYRLLKEVLEDAKEWVCSPKLPRQKGKIRLQPPDMPRKPLSAYFLYYTKKREVFQKAHPGLDAVDVSKQLAQEYKNLPIDKRLKYETLQAKAKQEYQQKLELFYKNHPEIPRVSKVARPRSKKVPSEPKLPQPAKEKPPPKERIPKKTSPPFQYYYLSELDKADKTVEDKAAFKEECKERWKLLNDREKITWINYAEQQYNQYEESMKTYMQNHPDYKQNPAKPILTKEDIQIKERSAGKPSKPPNSSYSHYARLILQSDEIKDVPVRDRLVYVANKWKTVPEEHKKQLKEQVTKMNKQYKIEFAGYLENLPEEERKRELQKNMPKRPQKKTPEKKNGREKRIRSPKKKKVENTVAKNKLVEPEQPPISAYKYFASMYTGEEPVAQAWKVLTPEQKEVYEDDLVKKKRDYIANFEKFLKSLTKEELEAFSNSRSQSKKNVEDDDDEEDEESSNESGTEDSGSDSAEEGLADEEGAIEEEDAE